MAELKGKVKDGCRAVVMSKILMPSEQLKLGSAYVTETLGTDRKRNIACETFIVKHSIDKRIKAF